MRQYNIGNNLIHVIQRLDTNGLPAVFINGNIGVVPHYVGVRQECILSPTLFNIFLERIMSDVLEEHEGTVSIAGRTITNLRFADDIDGLAGSEQELAQLVERIDQTSQAYGMEINTEKKTNDQQHQRHSQRNKGKWPESSNCHGLQIPGSHHIGCRIQSRNVVNNCPMHYHNDTTQANMERSEHHTRIQSQTNAHPHHIHRPLRLRDLDTNNRITEDQSHVNEMLPPPFAHFIQRPHHKWISMQKNTSSNRSLWIYITYLILFVHART